MNEEHQKEQKKGAQHD